MANIEAETLTEGTPPEYECYRYVSLLGFELIDFVKWLLDGIQSRIIL